ncbi:MAG: hypothetical protein J6N49_01195 [Alphaproteobacteria bacterium]|nr:hypothetical protein [Alphaproteobacteria bacterium]
MPPHKINIFDTLLTPKQKNNLLGIYKDYMQFVRGLEYVAQVRGPYHMSGMLMQSLYGKPIYHMPWHFSRVTEFEKQHYIDMVNAKPRDNTDYAYLSLTHTNTALDSPLPGLTSVPSSYEISNMDMSLPSPVERYLLAYPKGATIGDVEILLDGKYNVTYTGSEKDLPMKDLFENKVMHTELRLLMNMVDYFEAHQQKLERGLTAEVKNIWASEAMADFENLALEMLGSFADKTQEVCRQLYGGRQGDDFWKRAEQAGFISSAVTMQDYINLRHLMRHQFDSLDFLGSFGSRSTEKNKAMRTKQLESYQRICGKPLMQRYKGYIAILDDLRKVIENTHPSYIIREQGLSNNKFVAKLKELVRENPHKTLQIEVNYMLGSDKHRSAIRNIRKVVPNALIADDFTFDTPEFQSMESDYRRRATFFRLQNNLENHLMSYCLGQGKDYNRSEAWEYLSRGKLLTYAEKQKWLQYCMLRNDLSHNHFDQGLRQRLNETMPQYLEDACALDQKIFKYLPEWFMVEKDIFETTRKDGVKVRINYQTREISLNGQVKNNSSNVQSAGVKVHTDEYANGMGISTAGTEVVSCRLPNGISIDLRKQRIIFPDQSKLYLNGNDMNVFKTHDGKVITDKNFAVSEFEDKGKIRRIGSNDTCIIGHHHITTDRNEKLQTLEYAFDKGRKMTLRLSGSAANTQISFADGTVLKIAAGKSALFHNGKELSYATRKLFADSYGTPGGCGPKGYGSR